MKKQAAALLLALSLLLSACAAKPAADPGTAGEAERAAGAGLHTIGDAHIYTNHLEQVDLQLTREPYPLPVMKINPDVKSIFDFKYEDFQLENYQCHPAIKGQVSV